MVESMRLLTGLLRSHKSCYRRGRIDLQRRLEVRTSPHPPQGRGVGSDEADRLPQTVMDVQFGIPDPEIDSHVIR